MKSKIVSVNWTHIIFSIERNDMLMDKKIENRSENIDVIKGEGILLVVVGHIIQYVICKENAFNNVIFSVIYSFHMPLFMFVSGYLSYKKMIVILSGC